MFSRTGDVEKVLLLEDGIDGDGRLLRPEVVDEGGVFLRRRGEGVAAAPRLLDEEVGEVLRRADGRGRVRQTRSDTTLPLERVLLRVELDTYV